ncbi:MAG: hypothetical protein J6X02_01770 [Bacilli bacterium]|nr:hypothetical protein [Bacilli bacterium]
MLTINGLENIPKLDEMELDNLNFMIDYYRRFDEVKALGDTINISDYRSSSTFSLDNGKELVNLYMGVGRIPNETYVQPVYIYKGNYIYVYEDEPFKKRILSKERYENCNGFCFMEKKNKGCVEYKIIDMGAYLTVQISLKGAKFDRSIITNYLNGNNSLFEIHNILPKKDLVINYITPLNIETLVYKNGELIGDLKEGIFPENLRRK